MLEKFKSYISNNKHKFLIVGLGNPGIKYDNTRHNVGFKAIDFICENLHVNIDKIKFKSLISTCNIENVNCVLLKPMTYMNNSGEAVVQAMNFYKINIENVIVLYDDISLDVSKLRIRRKGSHGGHNGIKSIIALSGSEKFPRIKIGVGDRPHHNIDLSDWVLSNFTNNEMDLLKTSYYNCYNALKYILNDNIDIAMNKFNS